MISTPYFSTHSPIYSNDKPIAYNWQIASNIYKIPVYHGILDSENYFTDWEIEQINESLSDYACGNYKTGNIGELLKDLNS